VVLAVHPPGLVVACRPIRRVPVVGLPWSAILLPMQAGGRVRPTPKSCSTKGRDGWMDGKQESNDVVRASGHCLVGELPRHARMPRACSQRRTTCRDTTRRCDSAVGDQARQGLIRPRQLPFGRSAAAPTSRLRGQARPSRHEAAAVRAGPCGAANLSCQAAATRLSMFGICNWRHVARDWIFSLWAGIT